MFVNRSSCIGDKKTCKLFFDSAEAVAKCVKALDGKRWNSHILSTLVCDRFVSVRAIPTSVSETEIYRELQPILGSDLKIVSMLCKLNLDLQHKTAYLWFETTECAWKAQSKLKGFRFGAKDFKLNKLN